MINFQKIENEEYFYYTITNYLLNNFHDTYINVNYYHQSLKNFYYILKNLKEKMNSINDKQYSLFFEYTLLFILNSEYNDILSQINNIYLYEIFNNAMLNEINSVKSLTNDEIIKKFYKYNKKVEIKNNNIIFCDNSYKVIENYRKYYITRIHKRIFKTKLYKR